jgi:Right handed beta helix region
MSIKVRNVCLLSVLAILIGSGTMIPAAWATTPTVLSSCGNITAAGSYTLSKNLTSSGNCFVIQAPNVSIDMLGHKIKGNGSGSAFTDNGSEEDHASIVNGTISNFNVGINLSNSGSATIAIINSSNNASDGIFISRCCSTFLGITTNNNGANGIHVVNCCNTVTNIQSEQNADAGIFIAECCNTINTSEVIGNGGDGIEGLDCCTTVNNSVVNANSANGISLTDCCNFVIGSNVNGNSEDGAILTSDDNQVTSCKVNHNGATGLDLSDDTDNLVTNSNVKNNAIGIAIECPGNIVGVIATGNSGGNVVTTGGTCTTLDNKTP